MIIDMIMERLWSGLGFEGGEDKVVKQVVQWMLDNQDKLHVGDVTISCERNGVKVIYTSYNKCSDCEIEIGDETYYNVSHIQRRQLDKIIDRFRETTLIRRFDRFLSNEK